MIITRIIEKALDMGASDIHVREEDNVYVRINGELAPIDTNIVITQADMELFFEKYNPAQTSKMRKADFAFSHAERRFRANAFQDLGRSNMAIRVFSDRIPSLADLHFPPEMEKLKEVGKGLVLIIGETGSGKSTTAASILQHYNETRRCNILTIEDPVEYLYPKSVARVSQREVGVDVVSFQQGIKDALREDPDVILLGEMRDKETIETAIILAETGHQVFGTLHCRACTECLDRISGVFPGDSKEEIRFQTASVLQAVVHQSLLPHKRYGRIPLVEIMRMDPTMQTSLADPKIAKESIRTRIRTTRSAGSLHRVDAFQWLMDKHGVDPELAEQILTPDDYQLLMGGKMV